MKFLSQGLAEKLVLIECLAAASHACIDQHQLAMRLLVGRVTFQQGLQVFTYSLPLHADHRQFGGIFQQPGMDTPQTIAPQVKIIGVQAERAPAYYLSWREGKVVGTETCDTIADGLATRTPEAANVRDVMNLVDDVVLVSEEQLLRAIETLLLEEHVLAEPAGAASTAALVQSSVRWGDHVVLVVSGANISREVLKRAIGSS